MIGSTILATASRVEGRRVTTHELASAAMPHRAPEDVQRRSGIATRWWLSQDRTLSALAADVVVEAIEDAGLSVDSLARLIFVCSTGGDRLIPANANTVLDALGIHGRADGFDLNNACMGFLSAFDLATRSVATGLGPVAVVTVEGLSRHIAPAEPRSYLVLGDACAAVVVGAAEGEGGVLASFAANDGRYAGSVSLAHPGLSKQEEAIAFADSSADMTRVTAEALVRSGNSVLEEAGLGWSDVDWLVPHQPNGSMLDRMIDAFGVDPERVVRVVHEIGSVGAASIPFGLDALRRQRNVRAGETILMLGVGAGMAYGASLFRME